VAELLRSYRIAHARVTAIEPFEISLRENTPLTSINDPGALVEYLNQLNLKGDMVLDELKRVSVERTAFREKLEAAEKRTKEAWDEVAKLQEASTSNGDQDDGGPSHATAPEAMDEAQSTTDILAEAEPAAPVVKSPSSSIKSYTPSIPGLTLFSPKSKPAEVLQPGSETEEFFSYDSELPRLETELKESQNEISKLDREMTRLTDDLAVARESTQNMVKSLEDATREINTLREQKDRCELILSEHRLTSETTIRRLQSDLEAADGKLLQLEVQQSSEDSKANREIERMRAEVTQAEAKIQDLIAAKDKSLANTTQVQLDLDNLRAETAGKVLEQDQNAKRIETLNGLVNTLREQLIKANGEKPRIAPAVDETQAALRSPEIQLNSEKVATNGVSAEAETLSALSEPSAGKKKNKKKKKGTKAVVRPDVEAILNPTRSTESLITGNTVLDLEAPATTDLSETVAKLEEELNKLQMLLEEKDAAIERLHGKLKCEELMREEIESLRDELVHVGQEHVEAKDIIKDLIAERSVLENAASDLENQLSDLRSSRESDVTGSEQVRKDLAAQFDDLKLKATNLQTDLSVAQQLASSRFKDLTDLRTVLQKAQPELAALRTENAELKAMKEELSTKVTELQRTEARHDILRSELAELKKATSSKDAEMKTIVQRFDQESTARQKSDEALNRSNQDLQRSESEKNVLALSLEKVSKNFAQSREELKNIKARVQELENSLFRRERETEGLKEDIELKTAQHASAESLMSSMRDQTAEMAMQSKEARERCESLEDELADAHRLLSERSREGETMRRLIAEVEGRAETRVREMKDRMDVALEERDKAEDEASTANRRRVRELEEVRNKLREAERNLKRVEEDKEELEVAQRDWKKRREELEQKSEESDREADDVRRAMSELRDALDESERQARELEKQKLELRHSIEDTQLRLDKLHKSNKVRHPSVNTSRD
jgi:chromosome segregation ATPase